MTARLPIQSALISINSADTRTMPRILQLCEAAGERIGRWHAHQPSAALAPHSALARPLFHGSAHARGSWVLLTGALLRLLLGKLYMPQAKRVHDHLALVVVDLLLADRQYGLGADATVVSTTPIEK